MSGHLCLKWNNHSSAFLKSISTIQDKEKYCDATIACQGKYFPVHRIILSTCSDYFEEMFERMQCQHPYIVFKDIEPREMELLLNYMYQGEVNVVQEMLPTLIKAAEALRIKGLAVPDDTPSGKKRSSSSADVPQQKRRSEEVKRRRRNSSESDFQMGASSNNASNTECFLNRHPGQPLSERLDGVSSVDHRTEQTRANVIKEEPLDSCDYDDGSSPADDSLAADGQAAVSKEENAYVNFPITNDDSFVKTENDANSEHSYEAQASSWSEFGSASAMPNLPPVEMNNEDNMFEKTGRLEAELGSKAEPSTSTATFPERAEERLLSNIKRTNSEFECPCCEFKSKYQANIQRHILAKHVGRRPFFCHLCPMQFAQKADLSRHMRIHTGEKPFQCHRCLAKFRHSHSLKYHINKTCN